MASRRPRRKHDFVSSVTDPAAETAPSIALATTAKKRFMVAKNGYDF